MKKMIIKNLAMLIVGVTLATLVSAQPPNGFNYQAVVRNGDGEPVANQQVGLRITLQSEDGTTVYYSESHLVTTSPQGVVSIIVGNGEVLDGTFAYIPWGSADIFMKVEVDAAGGTDYSELGTTRLQSVPYALYAPNTSGASIYGSGEAGKVALWTGESSLTSLETLGFDKNLEVVSSAEANDEDPIFVVRNREGQIVFGVYQTGVRVYVDSEESKGSKGGFAVGGLTQNKEGEIEYFRVTPDSTRVYVDMSSQTKAGKGGFAVGGLTQSKALPTDLLYISADSARIYIDNDTGAKTGSKGGFAVGGLTQGKLGTTEDYLRVTRDSSRVYVNTDSKTGSKGGFAVGGLTQGKVDPHNFMLLTPENYLIGQEAGASLTTGIYNSFLGYQAGRSTTDGVSNIFLGYKSGYSNIGNSVDSLGSLNLFAGNESGYSNTSGYENVFLGNRSGYSNLEGYRNVFIGVESGEANTTGIFNVFIGNQSGKKNTIGENNVFIGYASGYSNDIGINNIFLGSRAGYSTTSGYHNIFMGVESGMSNTIGFSNVFIGDHSGMSNVSGANNVFLGFYAGSENTANYNTFIGFQSGKANTTGQYNAFLGYNAGFKNTTGGSNVFIGNESGKNNIEGENNVFLGFQSGYTNNASNNVFIGKETGRSNQSGQFNAFLGYNAGKLNTTGSSNVFIGNESGFSNSTGGNNVFLGYQAGYTNNASFNVFIGNESGKSNTSGTNNAFIGYFAGKSSTTGGSNVYLGNRACESTTGSSQNVAIGNSIAHDVTSTITSSVILGDNALTAMQANIPVNSSTFIGKNAGVNLGEGSSNVYDCIFLGTNAGDGIKNTEYSSISSIVAVGNSSGTRADGYRNVFIGNGAGTDFVGHQNTMIGFLVATQGGSGTYNVYIGDQCALKANGDNNTYVGRTAGAWVNGDNNVFLGVNAGKASNTVPRTESNRLRIGQSNLIYGEFDNNRVGINATNPTQTLDVNGNIRVRSIGSGAYSGVVNRTSDGTLTISSSDIRLKENISTLAGSLAKVVSLRGVNFTWKSEPEMGNRIGFIAQEVEKVVPELVFTNPEDGYKGVNYAEMTAVLVEAIKEQQKVIEQLKAEVEELKSKVK